MFAVLIKIKNIILGILFPPLCLNCRAMLNNTEQTQNRAEQYLCENCHASIKLNSSLFCPVCKLRLADNKKICNHSKKIQPYFYFLGAAGNYDDEILRNLIHGLKYQYLKNSAPLLGELIFLYLKNLPLPFIKNQKSMINDKWLVIPVPLHSKRERQRGFNQSKLIAEFIAEKFNLPLIEALKRIKNNKPQVGLKGNEERIENVKNCFAIQNPKLIEKKNILLIDDVFTSGATMNEVVKILKQNGARRIIALVLAKA